MPEKQHASWGELLREAVEKPGRMLEAYTAFHNYSFGNALLALEQCTRRNLQPGPLNTYNGWLERKRQVRKGEKGSRYSVSPAGWEDGDNNVNQRMALLRCCTTTLIALTFIRSHIAPALVFWIGTRHTTLVGL